MAKSDKHVPADKVAGLFSSLNAELRDARIRIAELECQIKLAEAAVMQAKLDKMRSLLLTDHHNN